MRVVFYYRIDLFLRLNINRIINKGWRFIGLSQGGVVVVDEKEFGQPRVLLDKNGRTLPTILKLNTTGENSRLRFSLNRENAFPIRRSQYEFKSDSEESLNVSWQRSYKCPLSRRPQGYYLIGSQVSECGTWILGCYFGWSVHIIW